MTNTILPCSLKAKQKSVHHSISVLLQNHNSIVMNLIKGSNAVGLPCKHAKARLTLIRASAKLVPARITSDEVFISSGHSPLQHHCNQYSFVLITEIACCRLSKLLHLIRIVRVYERCSESSLCPLRSPREG